MPQPVGPEVSARRNLKPPPLTADQRKAAFDRSLELRRERATLKHFMSNVALLSRRARLDYVWERDVSQGMKVYDLLTALPGVGRAKALILLAQAGIPAKNTVRACGPKQRERLFTLL